MTLGALRRCAVGAVLLTTLFAVSCDRGPTRPFSNVVPGSERSAHLQEMKDRVMEPSQFIPMQLGDLIALPRFPRAYTRTHLAVIATLEAQGVTVTGYLTRLLRMSDGDYHLELTATPKGRCPTWYKPRGLVITELTPGIRAERPTYTFERLELLCGANTPIRVSGWLLYDSPHSEDWFRSTPWEVHPITRIEVCCWRELG